jgi:sulfur-carrier protein adenylyltransferase/sulfurtransferase
MLLSNSEILRYGRHLLLPEIGLAGQEKLKKSSVLIVGAGGLGSPIAIYLAAAGIGKICIVEFDYVDESNLHRQILFDTSNVGQNKSKVAFEKLNALNPNVIVETFNDRLDSSNALRIINNYDVVVDGTDNFATRYLVNDACVLAGKPNIYGSVSQFEGQITVFDSSKGPCYRCLFPKPPNPKHVQNCSDAGVLGVLPGVIGMLQATEAIKLLLGLGESLVGRLLLYDALAMTFQEISLQKNSKCPVCGNAPTLTELIDYEAFCGIDENSAIALSNSGGDAVHNKNLNRIFQGGEITAVDLFSLIKNEEKITILDVRDPHEILISRLDKAINIPMAEISARLIELEREDKIIVVCRIGERSGKVAQILRANGFNNVCNLTGGLNQWSLEIDPNMPRY